MNTELLIDANVHNVIELGNNDDVLTQPPGAQHANTFSNTQLTCAGMNGCHGMRDANGVNGVLAIKGAHHNNTEGKVDNPLTDKNVGHHYRFLMGIKGFEDTDWQATVNANDHNEYFGATTPLDFADALSCQLCHFGGGGGEIISDSQTISGFCATCHGNFHSLGITFLGDPGIGGNTSSPFVRHPTDVVLPDSGEYANYTAYSLEAPIARTTVPDTPSTTVTPGATDVVM